MRCAARPNARGRVAALPGPLLRWRGRVTLCRGACKGDRILLQRGGQVVGCLMHRTALVLRPGWMEGRGKAWTVFGWPVCLQVGHTVLSSR